MKPFLNVKQISMLDAGAGYCDLIILLQCTLFVYLGCCDTTIRDLQNI